MNQLGNRRVLITGAASGIGRATARLFAAEGAALALLDHDPAGLDAVAAETGARRFPCDVAAEDAVTASVLAAADALGGLDGVVNAAGVARWGSVEAADTADWRLMLDVNLLGPLFVCRAAIPALRQAAADGVGATIVNVASVGALRPARAVSGYCASKAGVLMLSKCLAFELGPDIRVNAVCPGTTETPMVEGLLADPQTAERLAATPALRRLGTPDEIARALLHLTGPDSSYTNGAALVVDGGAIWH